MPLTIGRLSLLESVLLKEPGGARRIPAIVCGLAFLESLAFE
jgi:hypothetical protein